MHSVSEFEPKGSDVYAAQTLLNIQLIVVAVEVFNIYKEIKSGELHGQKLDLIRLVEGLFSIPFLLSSMYLMIRFKHGFSKATQRNIVKISILMMSENSLNITLKFAVGVKHIFLSQSFLTSMILPCLFFGLWSIILYFSNKKDGDYGAPPGLLYMQ